MFRAFVLLSVITLAAGPDASVLCRAWCGPEAPADECRHESSEQSPTLTAGDCCVAIESGVPATLASDVLTKVSSPGAQIIPAPGRWSARQSSDGRLGREPVRPLAVSPPRLSTILRI